MQHCEPDSGDGLRSIERVTALGFRFQPKPLNSIDRCTASLSPSLQPTPGLDGAGFRRLGGGMGLDVGLDSF